MVSSRDMEQTIQTKSYVYDRTHPSHEGKRTKLEPSRKKGTFEDIEYLIWRSIVRRRRLQI
jgi:hypothetical protein